MSTNVAAGAGMGAESLPQFSTDPWIYRIVVGVLGLVILVVIIGGILLALFSTKDMPQGLLAIGSTCTGGLVGLLVPSPVSRK
ncbi:MAG TPA: hypothetical protein VFQ30_16935 [Ktedonobacteraceae bacterium]|nr:hypothetical protein [Ktedonobacteraceae bacterium]